MSEPSLSEMLIAISARPNDLQPLEVTVIRPILARMQAGEVVRVADEDQRCIRKVYQRFGDSR